MAADALLARRRKAVACLRRRRSVQYARTLELIDAIDQYWDVELRHLRYFLAVGESLHFGRAAERLNIAQSSLSHQIRQLEAELKAPLFQRTRRKVQLTDVGRAFLDEAREILARSDRAVLAVRRAGAKEGGTLRVGCAYWVDTSRIVGWIRALCRMHPAGHCDLRTIPAPVQLAALRDGHLDVGFVRPPVNDRGLSSIVLQSELFVVALPARHRLAACPRVTASALAEEPFVLSSRSSVPIFYDHVLAFCRAAGFVPRAVHEGDHPDVVLQMVGAGLGISLVPASTRRMATRGVTFRRLAGPPGPVLETALTWRTETVGPLLASFLDLVRADAAPPRRRRSRRRPSPESR
jgi:DNA-binding transcriptional LysR family regulator